MNSSQDPNAGLPIRGNLKLIFVLSLIIAILMTAASIAGLLYGSDIYPAIELRRDLVSMDVVSVCLGLPVLLVSLGLARRGRLIGLLCWPGALFFVLYTYLIYVFAMPVNAAFLLHLALVALSLYTLFGLVASIDGKAVQKRLAGAVPETVTGVVLIGQGLLNFVWVVGAIIIALTHPSPAAGAVMANHVTDFLIAPAWFIGGMLLLRRQAFGYVTGLGLLLQGSMFIIAIIIITLRQLLSNPAPPSPANFVLVLSGALICIIPFILYARGVIAKEFSLAPNRADLPGSVQSGTLR